ncbi:MAG: succinate--CoA ligase subunit alpha [Acholeplasmatales bacterium]|nr:MAG: succinate--CoA ligase subunit alpha [Acholeplasmatales bacterium]
MSIFIDATTRVLVQGMTGQEGRFWSEHMMSLGTQVVCGVTPGKAGETVHDRPIYHTVEQALRHHTVDAAMVFVPPRLTKDAVLEALAAGIKKVVTIADGIPLHDTVIIRQKALECGARVIGGNTSGVITPEVAMMGSFPHWIERVYKKGTIGVMTRSGSLTNEVTAMIVEQGYGVSTLVGVGGDPVPATRFAELLADYQADDDTHAVVIIGELGGTMEEEVADTIQSGRFTKPLVAFLGGRNAPKGQKMGHAGAIITGGKGSVADKIKALEAVDAHVAKRPREVGLLLKQLGVKP